MKIGIAELFVIFIIVFIVIGPDRIPEYSKKAAKALKAFRNYTSEFSKEINESIVDPLKDEKNTISELKDDIQKPLKEMKKKVDDIL